MTITITVENGNTISGANSYVTVSGSNIYFEAYGETTWSGSSDLYKKQALLKSMRYLNNLPWKGYKMISTHTTSWPRSSVYDRDGVEIQESYIPNVVKDAQCELALRCLPTSLVNIQPDVTREDYITAESVGSLARSYNNNAPTRVIITVVSDLLTGLLRSNRIITVQRG